MSFWRTYSHYINVCEPALLPPTAHFGWQDGYGVLTIGERHYHIAVEYVQRQKEHHAAQQTIPRWERSDEDAGPNTYVPVEPADQAYVREEGVAYMTAYNLTDDKIPF